MNRQDRVLTTGQVAKLCQVAPRTVTKWFDGGRLKGYRIAGSRDRRIPVKELMRFMRGHGLPLGDLDSGATRILVVDPGQVVSDALATAIAGQSCYEVMSVESALCAGIAVARFEPHVVLVNPTTPEVFRAEFRAGSLTDTGRSEAKLVALADDEATAAEFRRRGFDACLVRPLAIDSILETVDRLVGLSASQPATL